MKRTLDCSPKSGKKPSHLNRTLEKKIAEKKRDLNFTLSDENIARALADIVNDTEDLDNIDNESFQFIDQLWDEELRFIQDKESDGGKFGEDALYIIMDMKNIDFNLV